MNKERIKFLETLKERNYVFDNNDILGLAYELIENIGDHDPYVRDDLIYPNLAHILHDNHLGKEDLKTITELLISDKYLHYDMENKIEFSSLRRTFTSLQLVIIIYVHNRDGLFTEQELKEVFRRILDYYRNETDLRGYHEKAGWIHSVAHTADMFAQLFKCKELGVSEFSQTLDEIKSKFKVDDYIYISNEDERTVTALMNLLDRNIISEKQWIKWIETLAEYERPKTFPEVYNINRNIKHLLRSLYFRVLPNEKYSYLSNKIASLLDEKVKTR